MQLREANGTMKFFSLFKLQTLSLLRLVSFSPLVCCKFCGHRKREQLKRPLDQVVSMSSFLRLEKVLEARTFPRNLQKGRESWEPAYSLQAGLEGNVQAADPCSRSTVRRVCMGYWWKSLSLGGYLSNSKSFPTFLSSNGVQVPNACLSFPYFPQKSGKCLLVVSHVAFRPSKKSSI